MKESLRRYRVRNEDLSRYLVKHDHEGPVNIIGVDVVSDELAREEHDEVVAEGEEEKLQEALSLLRCVCFLDPDEFLLDDSSWEELEALPRVGYCFCQLVAFQERSGYQLVLDRSSLL